jgi:Cd2+/Zn2+-exporting ATPase
MQISKSTIRTVYQNLIMIMAAKSVFVLLGVMGLASMWAAVFADVGISLIAILNAIRKQ